MKIIHINNSDGTGGASRACLDIDNALKTAGVDSKVLVQEKYDPRAESIPFVNNAGRRILFYIRFILDYMFTLFLSKPERGRFSFPFFGVNLNNHPDVKEADIIHLHWINQGFFSFKTFDRLARLNKPIVWTLHDMWAFTGGCHYSGGCDKYLAHCRDCPSLKFGGKNDLSVKIFKDKIKSYQDLDLNIVTCSKWLAGEAAKSYLLKDRKILSIPNAINVDLYKPVDVHTARKELNLSADKFLVLFGAFNVKEKRKGFGKLKQSLIYLYENYAELRDTLELVIFGSFDKDSIADIPFKTNFLGRLQSAGKVVSCYNAADVFVAPSKEDNLPNTVMEALSCGIPVVAFNIGGMPDMIDHMKNGYLAEPFSEKDFARGIRRIIISDNKDEFKFFAREKVLNNFISPIVGEKYRKLYSDLLQSAKD